MSTTLIKPACLNGIPNFIKINGKLCEVSDAEVSLLQAPVATKVKVIQLISKCRYYLIIIA